MIKKIKVLIVKIMYQLKMLKHRPRLICDSLFIRKDEFDKSLDMDIDKYSKLSKEEKVNYQHELVRKRNLAHELDCLNMDRKNS